MKFAVVYELNGKVIAKYKYNLGVNPDIGNCAWDAFNKFTKDHPEISMFDNGLVQRFEEAHA